MSYLEEAYKTAYAIHEEMGEPPPLMFDFGGTVWVYDSAAPTEYGHWRWYQNRWAVDPRAIHTIDPAQVEKLRTYAMSLVNAFPSTLTHLKRLGCGHAEDVLLAPIHTEDDITRWCYSIWNAATPSNGNANQYPFRVSSTGYMLKDRDFKFLHPDVQGHVAVIPADSKKTQIIWATPGTTYADKVGECLGSRHPVSLAAYGRKSKETS